MTSTGDGLNILIACDYLPHHNWMSFFCWYSLSKNLPDAKITVACHRRLMKYDFYSWTRRCNVPFVLHKATDEEGQIQAVNLAKPLLVIPPEAICVRDFDEAGFSSSGLEEDKIYKLDDSLCCDCMEEKSNVFVTYMNGWGKFVMSSWINKMSCPFIFGVKYIQGDMTTNEARIGKLWSMATPLFQNLYK